MSIIIFLKLFFRISIGDGAPRWYQYFLCGVKGITEVLPKVHNLKGMNVFAKGSIPQSAGLSSSSALVSAAALATAHANNVSIGLYSGILCVFSLFRPGRLFCNFDHYEYYIMKYRVV